MKTTSAVKKILSGLLVTAALSSMLCTGVFANILPYITIPEYNPVIAISVSQIRLTKSNCTGYVGGTLDIDYIYTNMKAPAGTWTSSDESVATVDEDGAVTFLAEGKVTITFTVDGTGTYECAINVKPAGITKR